jgi:hypothetical protein
MARDLSYHSTMRTILGCLMSTAMFFGFGLGLGACGGDARTPGGPDAAGPGGPGVTCGGFARLPCAASEYCDFPDNNCGVADQSGTCKPRPETCPLVAGRPTCGCDLKVYAGECPLYRAGTDLNASGGCDVMPGWFACGYTQCNLQTQYCLHDPITKTGATFSCVEIPRCASQPASCACLAGERCGNACTGDAAAGLTLTCP